MPIYEYRCGACGHELEALQKISDEPLADCPQCSTGRLKRLVSAPNFRLKGSGWYETDFKRDSDKKRNLADKGESTGDDKGDKPKSDDTKTAAKGNGADQAKTQTKAATDGSSAKTTSTDKSKSKPSAGESRS